MLVNKVAETKTELLLEYFIQKMGGTVEIISPQGPIRKLVLNNKNAYIVGVLLPFNSTAAAMLCKQKELTKNILKEVGISVPAGVLIKNKAQAKEALLQKKIKFPLVVKPDTEALGRGVVANILNEEELIGVVENVTSKFGSCVIEEYCKGDDYRFLVLQGEVIAVTRRIKPFVVGDGISSLENLIEVYNGKRTKKFEIDREVQRNLQRQNVSLQTVLEAGKVITLRENSNNTTGGKAEDATDEASLYLKKIAVLASHELGLVFSGVDIITSNIKATKGDVYFVTEVNSAPGFDLHFLPDFGEAQEVREPILKAMFE